MRLPLRAVSLLLAVLLATSLSAQEKKPVTPEDFHSLTWVGSPQWSPVDDRIVFVTSRSNEKREGYDSHIWVLHADGVPGTAPKCPACTPPFLPDKSPGLRQLTHASAANTAPRWSEDGRWLVFVSTREKTAQAYLLPMDLPGEARLLTDFDLSVQQVQWVPGQKARVISFVAAVPADWQTGPRKREEMKKPENKDLERGIRVIRQAIYRAGTSYFEELRPHLFTLEVDTGEIRQLTAGEASVRSYSWSPDGGRAAVIFGHLGDATDISRNVIRVVARDGTVQRELSPKPSYYNLVLWRPGTAQVLVIEGNWLGFREKIYYADADSGQWRELHTSYDGDHSAWTFSRDGKRLFGLTQERGDVHLWTFDVETGRGRKLTGGARQLGQHSNMGGTQGIALSPDGSRFVVSETKTDRPEELVIANVADGKTTALTDFNREWRAARNLIPAEKFTFKARDGVAIDAWLHPPAGLRPGRRYPMVLQIHGGPRTMYGEHFVQEFQILAGQGHGVLYVNPRGSTGYGEAFTRATPNNWGGTPYEDLMDAVDEAIKRYPWIDPDRLGVAGGSYGGYMTAWIIGQTTRFKAAVPMRGVYNFFSFPLTTDIPHFTEYEFDTLLWGDPMKYWKFSPLAYANKVKTPALIIHSENDFRAPMPDAEQYYLALRLHGVPAEFVRYAGEGHELSRSGRPDRRVDRLKRIAEWFRRWLDE